LSQVDDFTFVNQCVRNPTTQASQDSATDRSEHRTLAAFDAPARTRGRISGPACQAANESAGPEANEQPVPNGISTPPIDLSDRARGKLPPRPFNDQRERDIGERGDLTAGAYARSVNDVDEITRLDAGLEFLE
jgi:hypothetical protein